MTVHLVGAGPGDPGLITVRGAEVLGLADVVVYDRLAAAALLDLAPADAERIDVGKSPGHSRISQDEINRLLVERGRRGDEVVRLKGGDPFLFARGGEEAAALAGAGVPFTVVPGVTSAIAVPAYAGVPVTRRHSSTAVTVVTGHEDPSSDVEVDWESVARVGGTIVVLMGAARMPSIADRLMTGGRAGDTPVTAVRWGTRPDQSTIRTTLAEVGEAGLEPPVTIVIGAVAGLDLGWFERRPLFARSIGVTRARDRSGPLSARLRALGAAVVEVPLTQTAAPEDTEASAAALTEVSRHDWVVLTSANGVDALFDHVRDARDLAGCSVAAVGPATAAALRAHGIEADLVPRDHRATGLLAEFDDPPAGGSVLYPRAEEAEPTLVDGLTARGWTVADPIAYRTVPLDVDPADSALLRECHAITVASGSTVRALVRATGSSCPPVVCIGPSTAEVARDEGLTVAGVAEPHTAEGLVAAVVAAVGRVEP